MKKLPISIITSILLFSQLNAIEKLDDVVITAKSQTSSIDTAGSYTIISQEEIKQTNANSIAEVLQGYAGISTGVNSGSQYGRSSINLRGMDSKHSLILIDGRRISASDALIGMSDFAYNWIPLNAIEKIEVVKGPMSSLYGSSAIGGVINIITKKPTDEIKGEFNAKYGFSSAEGGDEQEYSIRLGGKITDKLSATFSGQIIDTEPTKESSNATLAKMEGRNSVNGALNLWYDIDNTQQITISSMKGNEKRDNIKYDEYYDIDKSQDAIGYEKRFGDVKMNLKYYISSLDAHSDDSSLLYTHKMDDEVANAEFALSAFAKNYIVFGAERRVEKYHKAYDNTPAKDFKDERDYTSLYLQDEIEITDKTLLTLGVRYDKHEKFGAEVSPKAYLVYKLDEANRLKGGYGHGFNAPSLTQNSDAYVLSYPIRTTPPMLFYRFHGNSNLKPEVSDSFEIGYEYQKNQMIFKTTAFYTKISDLITYKDNGTTVSGPITYQEKLYSNVNEATVYGLEAEYEKERLLSNLDIYIGYSYLHTKDESTGEELLLRPSHKVNLKLTTQLPYDIKSTLRVDYIGEQYNGDKDIGAYATAGLQFSKEMFKNLTLYAGVENLTDKELNDDYDFALKRRLVYGRLNYKF